MRSFSRTFWLAIPALAAGLLLSPPRAQAQAVPDWVKPLLDTLSEPAKQSETRFQDVNKTFTEDLAVLFRARVLGLREEEFFQYVIEQLSVPGKFDFDPALLKRFNLNDKSTRDMLRRWRAKFKEKLDQNSLDDLKKILQQEDAQFGAKFMTGIGPVGIPMGPGLPAIRFQPSGPTQNMPRWMRDFLRTTERSRLGDYLKKSPSWNKNVTQLRGRLKLDQTQASWQSLAEKWKLDSLQVPGAQSLFKRLSNMTLPDWNTYATGLPGLSFSGIDAPGLALPATPGFGGWQGAEVFLWPILLLILAVCAWRFFRGSGSQSESGRSRDLGPWPVDIAAIGTRSDVILAFEYLAILRLGTNAKTWNHRLIAAQWIVSQPADAALGDAALRLAGLYEWARYTDGEGPLDDGAQQDARHVLGLFAKAAP